MDAPQTRPDHPRERPAVLVVEADDLLCWAFRDALVGRRVDVRDVGTTEAALAAIRQRAARLVVAVVDPQMPRGSDAEVLPALQALAATCRVLGIAADDVTPEDRAALCDQADEVLVKPLDLDRVVARVRALASLT